uniref:NADH-ubiquinone oxidoreductase chain 5 n=1 Tax=Bothropolys sp. SP-2004 TaxID=292347 RepID=A5D6J7_9MYRI|nr:NADH dehydrogenase subunit 5 [Bothropolys sp. SP-2004]
MSYNLCKVSSYWLMLMSGLAFPLGIWMGAVDKAFYLEWWVTSLGSTNIVFAVIGDWMALVFFSFVFFISSCVMFYSVDYMSSDKEIVRFGWLVLLFVISMMLLIFSPNLISILLGWDGLGLVSYCLVIYYQNVRSYNSGMITVLSNRIGDVALLLGISWMVSWGGWSILSITLLDNSLLWFWLVGLLMVAGMTKSAQIPFSAWLPAAMAAPTPVSALVHSSTLVTAGVYLMVRFSPLLLDSTFFSSSLLLISTLTMFMSGICANYETDLKKVIALSTLSQLGLMMMSLSLGFVSVAYFHLLTHALFKALLFMCAGAIIHSSGESQDVRLMGGLVGFMPLISVSMNSANFALCGMPFMTGFYSKDLIIELTMGDLSNMLIFLLLMISVGLTAMYSFRLSYYSMWSSGRGGFVVMADGGMYMNYPIILLSFLAIFGGGMMSWLLMPVNSMVVVGMVDKLFILSVVSSGVYLGMMLGWNSYGVVNGIEVMMGSMWFMPVLSGQVSGYFFMLSGKFWMYIGDFGWGELLGGMGVSNVFTKMGVNNQSIQDNSLKLYITTFVLILVFLVFTWYY